MSRRYIYAAETLDGQRHEFTVDSMEDTIAHTEAKIEVERWLAEQGDTPDHLLAFDLVSVRPL